MGSRAAGLPFTLFSTRNPTSNSIPAYEATTVSQPDGSRTPDTPLEVVQGRAKGEVRCRTGAARHTYRRCVMDASTLGRAIGAGAVLIRVRRASKRGKTSERAGTPQHRLAKLHRVRLSMLRTDRHRATLATIGAVRAVGANIELAASTTIIAVLTERGANEVQRT